MAILDADKLEIYNGALRRLGSREIASLAENRKPRRVLDGVWGASSDIVLRALERGEWNFAIRTVQGTYSTSVEPPFGFKRAYDKPDDFRRLASLCADARLSRPLTDDEYVDEAGYWFTDHDVIYVRYVSSRSDYGFNSSAWTETFRDYLKAWMAWEACEPITNSTSKRDRAQRDMDIALATAKSHDAMQEGVKFPPSGSWVTTKRGSYGRGRDR